MEKWIDEAGSLRPGDKLYIPQPGRKEAISNTGEASRLIKKQKKVLDFTLTAKHRYIDKLWWVEITKLPGDDTVAYVKKQEGVIEKIVVAPPEAVCRMFRLMRREQRQIGRAHV